MPPSSRHTSLPAFYYPFGMVMPGREYTGVEYKFGFNGKEKEIELYQDNISFEARSFDCRIARFFQIDPKSQEYPWQSPYCYFNSSPIWIIDFLGEGQPAEQESEVPKTGDNNNSGEKNNSEPKPKSNNPNPTLSERIKIAKYSPRYENMKFSNPQIGGENIRQYEVRIMGLMLQTYGSKKWMWSQPRHSSNPSNDEEFHYIFIGGLVLPEIQQNITVPLNIVPTSLTPGNPIAGTPATGTYNTGTNVGMVSLNLSNTDPTGTVTYSMSLLTPRVGLTNLAINQTLGPLANVNVNFNVTTTNSTLTVRWAVLPSAMVFNFNITNSISVYPLNLVSGPYPNKVSSSHLSIERRNLIQQNPNIWN